MSEESKVVDINSGKADAVKKDDVEFSRDYEGGTVVVDFKDGILGSDGEPSKAMIASVIQAEECGAIIEVAVSLEEYYKPETAAEVETVLRELFSKTYPIVVIPDCVELWSSKAVQTNGKGLRMDGADQGAATMTVTVMKDDEGLGVSMTPPKITVAHEQVASIAMYLHGVFQRALGAISNVDQESISVSPDQLTEIVKGEGK